MTVFHFCSWCGGGGSGLPSPLSVYASDEGVTVQKDPFVPLLCCFVSDTFPFVSQP